MEIHRVNQGWHSFETSNRFLDIKNKYLQSRYLQQKNILQDELISKYPNMIIVEPIDDTGFPRIAIKEEYQFDKYKDACHIKKINTESKI